MNVPASSQIHSYLPNAYFADSWTISGPLSSVSALEIYLANMAESPDWMNALMVLRNQLCRIVGLKNLGTFDALSSLKQAKDYEVGDRAGIFSLVCLDHDEVILEDCDQHLDVRVSFFVERESDRMSVTVTTVVQVKNWLGRFYMVPVAPIHKLILWRSSRAIKSWLESQAK